MTTVLVENAASKWLQEYYKLLIKVQLVIRRCQQCCHIESPSSTQGGSMHLYSIMIDTVVIILVVITCYFAIAISVGNSNNLRRYSNDADSD
jgi:hypothetical protein